MGELWAPTPEYFKWPGGTFMSSGLDHNQLATTAILPRKNMAGPTLGAVTMVMSFLACLALGAAILVGLASERWLSRATSAFTVQIIDTENLTSDDQVNNVMRELEGFPGVIKAQKLGWNDMVELLEPWLGAGNVTKELPLPILVEITPDDNLRRNADALNIRLQAVAPGAHLDTHGRWRQTLERTSAILRIFAAFVLLMVGIATLTVLIFATRAGLLANNEILQVLHQIGAHDTFISRHFEIHFVKLTLYSSLAGLLLAGSVFLLLGELFADARSSTLLIWLIPVPCGFVFLSWFVTRRHVLRNLQSMV